MKLRHGQAVALMVLVTAMWSVAGVVTRHLEAARSFEVTFWRSLFTLLSLLVILPLWQGRAVFARMPWRSRYFWLSGVCWSVMFTAFMVALTLTAVANVLITMAVGPLVTALGSTSGCAGLDSSLKPSWRSFAAKRTARMMRTGSGR